MPHDAAVTTLDNGVRVVVFPLPHLATVSVSVFVRSGSQHEAKRLNGIGHVIEHMAFKGTRTRDCQQINLDAELLGAEVNAHTDKDHTAFHMRGHARDARTFIEMMGDIVQHGTFPDEELTRERQVLLQEFVEHEDDPMAAAFELFDVACYGEHPAAQPVIGSRSNLRRFTRDDLVAFIATQYTGVNTIIGIAGNVDPAVMTEAARDAFSGMPRGESNRIVPPAYLGGIKSRRLPGGDQIHVVIGFAVPSMASKPEAFRMAAALFGEGMSSPFLDRVRERRGLVYHADCYTDVRDAYGQFVIEASTTPQHLDAYLQEVTRLLIEHAATIDPLHLQRARNQLTVRTLFGHEAPEDRLERAAMDLFALDRIRSQQDLLAGIADVDAAEVRQAFVRMLEGGAAVGAAGNLGKATEKAVSVATQPLMARARPVTTA